MTTLLCCDTLGETDYSNQVPNAIINAEIIFPIFKKPLHSCLVLKRGGKYLLFTKLFDIHPCQWMGTINSEHN